MIYLGPEGPRGVQIIFKPGVDIRRNDVIPNMILVLLWDQRLEIDACTDRHTDRQTHRQTHRRTHTHTHIF